MQILCLLKPEKIYDRVHELIRMAYPSGEITREESSQFDIKISIELEEQKDQVVLKGRIISGSDSTFDHESCLFKNLEGERSKQVNKLLRMFTYRLLARHLRSEINSYGILTGMRPVKLVHRFLDDYLTSDAIQARLEKEYLVSPKKARLLLEVALNNRPFLLDREKARKNISVYLGIPYCPTRCYYCSFPGAVVKDYEKDITPYMNALLQEMRALGAYIKQNGLLVQSIYFGGGTPTVLSTMDMARVFEALHDFFISGATEEITVEAGRPDTLSLQKLILLQQAGVSRVCINPQTMNDSTLKRIGRDHDRKGVVRSVEWARQAGIRQINMDLIVGLPGESLRENTYTAEEILKLNPENVTVHTLALKRGSPMAQAEGRMTVNEQVREVEKAVDFFSSFFREAGYSPYYLYRQKYMKASMENTAYAREGSFCLYNIQMIEERQTIIGLGGGAASKFVNPSDWSLSSFYNPKDPRTYCESVERLITRKVDNLKALN